MQQFVLPIIFAIFSGFAVALPSMTNDVSTNQMRTLELPIEYYPPTDNHQVYPIRTLELPIEYPSTSLNSNFASQMTRNNAKNQWMIKGRNAALPSMTRDYPKFTKDVPTSQMRTLELPIEYYPPTDELPVSNMRTLELPITYPSNVASQMTRDIPKNQWLIGDRTADYYPIKTTKFNLPVPY